MQGSESPIQDQRVRFLENEVNAAVDSLRRVVALGRLNSSINRLESPSEILHESERQIRALIPFSATAYFLVDEETGAFEPAFVNPPEMRGRMIEEWENLNNSGTVAFTLEQDSSLFQFSITGRQRILLHSIHTPARVRGAFVGLLSGDEQSVSDIKRSLVTMNLIHCASQLESLELYRLIRSRTDELHRKVEQLEASDRDLESANRLNRELMSVIGNSPVVVFVWSAESGWPVRAVSPNVDRWGYTADAVTDGRSFLSLVHPEDREELTRMSLESVAMRKIESSCRYRIMSADGGTAWVEEFSRRSFNDDGELSGSTGVVVDITSRVGALTALREAEARFRAVFDNSGMGIALVDTQGQVVQCNPAAEKILGYSERELRSMHFSSYTHEDDLRENRRLFSELSSGQIPYYTLEKRYLHKKGEVVWCRLTVSRVENGTDTGGLLLAIMEDISDRKDYEEKLSHLALHDSLTELPNRTLLTERLRQAIERQRRSRSRNFSLLLLDLDDFKKINDTFGHSTGDSVLIETGRRIVSAVRGVDTVCRMGGDEFVVLLEDLQSESEGTEIARRIQAAISQPLLIDGYTLTIGCSIGMTNCPDAQCTPQDLLRDTDIAMYESKLKEKGRIIEYHSGLKETFVSRFRMEKDLERGLDGDELCPFFQTIHDVENGHVVGVEALVRWFRADGSLVPTVDYIAIAEESDQIHRLGERMLEISCLEILNILQANPALYDRQLFLSVNVSLRQLVHGGFMAMIHRVLDETQFPAERLRIELTETTVMKNPRTCMHVLRQLRELGMGLSIDDFGTGYSSLAYLQRLPVTSLKIDRAFIAPLPSDVESGQIVSVIINLAHQLGLDVVAEGVETSSQLINLRQLNCDYAQGFHYSMPMSAKALASFISGESA